MPGLGTCLQAELMLMREEMGTVWGGAQKARLLAQNGVQPKELHTEGIYHKAAAKQFVFSAVLTLASFKMAMMTFNRFEVVSTWMNTYYAKVSLLAFAWFCNWEPAGISTELQLFKGIWRSHKEVKNKSNSWSYDCHNTNSFAKEPDSSLLRNKSSLSCQGFELVITLKCFYFEL